MSDYIVRATAAQGHIRAYAAVTTQLCETARTAHSATPAVTVALGRLLTAGSLMGGMSKNADEVLTLRIDCEGPLSGMTVTANGKAEVKGFAFNHDVDSIDPLKVSNLIGGAGKLTIIKDIGLKEPYVGTSPLATGEIAEDLTYYYAMSEQIPTSVALGVTLNDDHSVQAAGGFIIQLMPDIDDALVDQLEAALSHAPSVTDMLAAGKTPEDILHLLLDAFDLDIIDTLPTAFVCDCSRDRVHKALMSVGEKDIRGMIAEGETVEINCDFCGRHYYFTPEDLQKLLAEIRKQRQ